MYLEENVLSMDVMISLKPSINRTLPLTWSQFQYNKDSKNLFNIKFQPITAMAHHKTVWEVFIHYSQNHPKKI